MVRRLALSTTLAVLSAALCAPPAIAQPSITVQEALLRAKPGVVLIIAEVASEVTLDCGTGPQTITPPVFRETGTGWFVDETTVGDLIQKRAAKRMGLGYDRCRGVLRRWEAFWRSTRRPAKGPG